MSTSSPGGAESIQEDIDAHKHKPGALLPVLHAIQDRLGYIPTEALPRIAQSLHLTRAEVHGVITFYHHFRTRQPGSHIVEICRAEACQARGGRDLESHALARLGIDYHHTTSDGAITLEPVYCLGNCACGPSIRVGDRVRGRFSAAAFDRLVDELVSQAVEVR